MRRVRVVPLLLLRGKKVVKTQKFRSAEYIGDPVNTLRIFNEKEVDEIFIVDISRTKERSSPDVDYIKMLNGECFMPLSYGGGINSSNIAFQILDAGIEKIVLGAQAFIDEKIITQVAKRTGTQSVVVSIDYRRDWLGRPRVFVNNGTKNTGFSFLEYAKKAESLGAGELLFQSIDRDGTFLGYDLEAISEVASEVRIPVVAAGGASCIDDFFLAIEAGASAVAAGSLFVYKGLRKGILINYPQQEELKSAVYNKL